MVVIRNTISEVKSLFGTDWENEIFGFSRVIGFTYEIDSKETKIELNPDRPDLYSLLSIHRSFERFSEKVNRKGLIKSSNISVIEENVTSRPYMALFATESQLPPTIIDILRSDFLEYSDKLSETTGKQRKKFAVGVHDRDKVRGTIRYGTVDGQVNFKTFDDMEGTISELTLRHEKGIKYKTDDTSSEILAIKDESGIISVPPMFNSYQTRVDNKTSRILVDVTATSQQALNTACKLLIGYFLSKGIDVEISKTKHFDRHTIDEENNINLDLKHLEKLSGIKAIKSEDVRIGLDRMGYSFVSGPEKQILKFKVPVERIDVMGEVDLIEDYLKFYGYSNIEERVLTSSFIGNPSPQRETESIFRYLLSSLNFQEVKSFVLSRENYASQNVKIRNPKSEDFSSLRDALWNGLVSFLETNRSASYPQKLFEVGDVIINGRQETRLGCISCSQDSSYSEIKGVLDAIVKATELNIIELIPISDPHFIKGRCGLFNCSGIIERGILGEVSPEEITKHQITLPVSYLEFTLALKK